MCGIVGYVGDGQASDILVRSLKRLEYRGYDSAGVATCYQNRLFVEKDSGKIEEINNKLGLDTLPGHVGVAHTRWATHGAPTKVNAHPHTDCTNTIAVVHNGVLENFMQLKKELTDLNHTFVSKTDTEVIPHLVEEGLRAGESVEQAFLKALRKLEGSYALAMISTSEPDKLYAARKEAPLIIGVGKGFNMVASDITALLDMTQEMVFLHDRDMAVISKDSYRIIKIDTGEGVERPVKTVAISVETAEKQGHPHFMLKEIYEQPQTLRDSLRLQQQYLDLLAELLDKGRVIFLVGAGTSYNACLAGSYQLSQLARLPSFPVIASEFIPNYGSSLGADTVVLAVSQSGETADVLTALDFARMRACTILGLTNTVGSTLTRVARAYILQNSGPEIGVAATKTFTSQVLVLAQTALRLARLRGKIAQFEMDEFKTELLKIPRIVEEVLMKTSVKVKELAKALMSKPFIFILGRGISTSTAYEGRLKIMELSYIPCIAYPAGESKHGPISVIEESVPVVFVVPPDEYRKLNIGSIMEMKARGAYAVVLGDEADSELMELADFYIGLPKTHPLLTPITYAVPFQLIAYHLAVMKGYDPDKPRNLAKSVTVL
ncbi:MAG: glutamine--fructose-6-phosphate transaminase (isomerizing) [Candidatus Caldarchaeum sp.]|nr:glutamine--fructose-6-phosphate transaminase (isomerizing) [Candidatus Caldarchaeum sp.]MDW7977254.1 glutamine--fructose-6-phosphate transaminase (isomerizing) [Candidatus Caldarchaeum sp.]MDW8359881.1 glutamine--fructose-6-phosphate transaminase (isomerizing) [Candidatus Caldarchaeum sp.]